MTYFYTCHALTVCPLLLTCACAVHLFRQLLPARAVLFNSCLALRCHSLRPVEDRLRAGAKVFSSLLVLLNGAVNGTDSLLVKNILALIHLMVCDIPDWTRLNFACLKLLSLELADWSNNFIKIIHKPWFREEEYWQGHTKCSVTPTSMTVTKTCGTARINCSGWVTMLTYSNDSFLAQFSNELDTWITSEILTNEIGKQLFIHNLSEYFFQKVSSRDG